MTEPRQDAGLDRVGVRAEPQFVDVMVRLNRKKGCAPARFAQFGRDRSRVGRINQGEIVHGDPETDRLGGVVRDRRGANPERSQTDLAARVYDLMGGVAAVVVEQGGQRSPGCNKRDIVLAGERNRAPDMVNMLVREENAAQALHRNAARLDSGSERANPQTGVYQERVTVCDHQERVR